MRLENYNYIPLDQKILRLINETNVLTTILKKEPISRSSITKITGLHKSTVSNIVDNFIKVGLIYEEGRGDSKLGKKPVNLWINEKYANYGIIDVQRRITTIAVCNLKGQVLNQKELSTMKNAESFFNKSAKKLSRMLHSFSDPLAGVSIVLPCPVNSMEGSIYWSDSLRWKKVPVKRIIEQHIDSNIFVENDARAGALAELFFGAAHDLTHFVFVLVCEGIGTGIVISKRIYYGAHSIVGEFGSVRHMIKKKYDESSGWTYWENIASDLAVVRRYCELAGEPFKKDIEGEMQRIINLVKSGDNHAKQALKETARHLGECLANVNWVLNPEHVIIGGKITQVWDLIFPEMIAGVESQTPYEAVPIRDRFLPSLVNRPTFERSRALIFRNILSGWEAHLTHERKT